MDGATHSAYSPRSRALVVGVQPLQIDIFICMSWVAQISRHLYFPLINFFLLLKPGRIQQTTYVLQNLVILIQDLEIRLTTVINIGVVSLQMASWPNLSQSGSSKQFKKASFFQRLGNLSIVSATDLLYIPYTTLTKSPLQFTSMPFIAQQG